MPGGEDISYRKRFEAEDLALENYSIEEEGGASGDGQLRLVSKEIGTASASLEFDGASGSYDLELSYYDERDGQGSVSLMVGDRLIETWDLTGDNEAFRTVSVTDVSIATGEKVSMVGRSEDGERARLDYIEISREGSVDTGRYARSLEVEAMSLDNYTFDDKASASGDAVAKLDSKSLGVASAKTVFEGPDGYYDLALTFFDESDGQGDAFIFVDGRQVGSWELDIDDDTYRTEIVKDVELDEGSEIEILGYSDAGERARLDVLEIMSAETDSLF